MAAFAELTEAQRERLEMLAEEAAEVVKACTKTLRHGYHSYNPDEPGHGSNGDDVERELKDLWTVAERMMHHGDIRQINFFDTAKVWAKKMKYTHHQPEFYHPTLERKTPEKQEKMTCKVCGGGGTTSGEICPNCGGEGTVVGVILR